MDLKALVADPEFQSLPAPEQRRAASALDPNFKSIPDEFHQDYALTSLAPDPYTFTDQRHGLPSGMTKALEGVESGGQPTPDTATSPTGVRGRFQITKDAGHEVGLPDELWDNPFANMTAAGTYLAKRVQQAGNLRDGLNGYGGAGIGKNPTNYADLVFAKMKGFNASASTTDQPVPPLGLGEQARQFLARGEQQSEGMVRRLVGADPYGAGTSPVHDLLGTANTILNPEAVAAGNAAGFGSEASGIGNPDLVNNLTQVLTAVAPSIPRMLGRVFQGARMLSPAARAAEAARPVAQTVTQTPPPVTLFDQYEKPMELATPTSSVRMVTPSTPAASSSPGFLEGKMKAILMSAGGTLMATGHMPSPQHLAIAGGAYAGYKATRAAAKLYDAAMGSPITQRMMEKLLTLGPKDGDFIPLSRALVSAVGGPEALWADDTASPSPSTEGTRR